MTKQNLKFFLTLFSLVFLFILLFTLLHMTVWAAGETGETDGWYWKVLDDGTLGITGCTTTSGQLALVIPDSLNTGSGPVAVTRIENNAFKHTHSLFFPNLEITSLSIPDSVTSIGDSAFYGCHSMTDVTLNQNLQTIGASAFYNCSALSGIDIPDTVVAIGDSAFSYCYNLGDMTLRDSSQLESIGSQAFCDSGIEALSLPDSVMSIGEDAFNGCRFLVSITLPNNTVFTSIPDRLFSECESLQTLEIPEYVTAIGVDALNGCNALTEITVDEDNTAFSSEDGVLYNSDKTTLICHPAGRQGGLVIPDSVTEICDYAFLNSTSLTYVSIPGSVTEIGEGAFFNCNNTVFEEPVVPDSVTSIGAYAFNACNRLTGIIVPEGISSLGEYTFYNCTDMSEIALPESLESIGEGAFMGCDSLENVVIPEGVTSIGDSAFAFCTSLTKAVILGSTTGFGSNVFQYTDIASDGIYGRSGSQAQTYSEVNSINFYIVCVVSFETSGGSVTPNMYVAQGDTISEPFDPTLTGFAFGGWYQDEECTDCWNFGSDTVSGDMVLYAKWSPVSIVNISAIEGVTVPERGTTPILSITETDQYTGIVTWNPADNPFAASTIYTATITLTPKAGYTLNGVEENFFTVAGATSVSNAADSGVIIAVFPATGAASSGGRGSGSPSAPTTPAYRADVTTGNGSHSTLPITVRTENGTASVNAGSQNLVQGTTVITIPSIPYVYTYSVAITVPELSTTGEQGTLTLDTDAGSVTVPSDMLTGIPGISGSKTQIAIAQGDKEALPDEVKNAIGDRPLISLTLSIDGKQTDWSNPAAPVTVSIPYTPTASELANPESIVVWYIDGSGKAVSVPNGRYDAATGTVIFSTTHFSDFAVTYKKVSFNDVSASVWYHDAVSFIAAREITSGTGGGNYSPEAKLTRGEFIVLMMRAYGIAPDENPADNFVDAGNTYYTNYLAAAKRLGISAGIGNNMYAPTAQITRQEMFTLLYNMLKVIGQLPLGDSGKTLTDFTDAGQVSDWATEAMTLLVKTNTIGGSGGKLNPTGTTTRAEMAQVLYNLLNK